MQPFGAHVSCAKPLIFLNKHSLSSLFAERHVYVNAHVGFICWRHKLGLSKCSVQTYLQFRCPCRGACKEHPLLRHCQMNPERTGNLPGQQQQNPPHRPPSARTHSRDIQQTRKPPPNRHQVKSGTKILVLLDCLPGAARSARAAVVFYSCLGECGLMSWRWVGTECPIMA